MAIVPLVVEVNLVKCRQRFGFLPRGKRPTLAKGGRKRRFKIEDDDDIDGGI